MENKPLETIEHSSDITDDIAIFNALKPYIGHCLTLNHDINNPLAGIIGYSEFLLEDSDQFSDTHREFIRQILECGERIKKLVEGLCEEKIALAEKIDLKSVTEAYKKIAKPLSEDQTN